MMVLVKSYLTALTDGGATVVERTQRDVVDVRVAASRSRRQRLGTQRMGLAPRLLGELTPSSRNRRAIAPGAPTNPATVWRSPYSTFVCRCATVCVLIAVDRFDNAGGRLGLAHWC